ncbi:transporter [Trypanosoma theileri]|uniref:Transporter n=1 Tax=Trypanosoma theileri TaxID=67003 RepID=A0A1X0NIY1_9TRYP|nr:transporter [Trypanosoma theileri]ORC84724.1 transporter [Trypanosoma theileri]
MNGMDRRVRFSFPDSNGREVVNTLLGEVEEEDDMYAAHEGSSGYSSRVLQDNFVERDNYLDNEESNTIDFNDTGGTRSSQLFESVSPIILPLTPEQDSLAKRLNFLKKWYLLTHVAYILLLALCGSLLLYLMEKDLDYVDAFFIAMSSVCCCGLQTVDVAGWKLGSNLLRHFLMIGGGIVFTSAHQPLLRLWMLSKIWRVFDRDPNDSIGQRALRASKRMYAERLWYTSLICAFTPLFYFFLVNATLMFFLAIFNQSHLSPLEVFEMIIASFHSSIFLSMEQYAKDPAVVLLVTMGCALGFTLFPVVLRGFFHLEWFMFHLLRKLYIRFRRPQIRNHQNSVFLLISEDSPLLANAPIHQVENIFRDSDMKGDVVNLNVWDRGFRDILASKQPVSFHAFLFIRSETVYLGVAWFFITLVQALPFWLQQWSGNGLLAPFSTPYKIFLSLCQAAVVRFAAASFVPCLKYSNAHIAITILCMFLPALPISTDRTYRKWKQMFRTSVVRLLTSRLFWLFSAMLSIIFAEENWLVVELNDTPFDIMTRSLFEVISAFSGCGLSLSLSGSAVSFVGSLSIFSKLVVAAVILGGRHRTVDLGIDLGFAVLQADGQQKQQSADTRSPPTILSTHTTDTCNVLKEPYRGSSEGSIHLERVGSVQSR